MAEIIGNKTPKLWKSNGLSVLCCAVLYVVYDVSSFMHSCKSFEIHYYKHPSIGKSFRWNFKII